MVIREDRLHVCLAAPPTVVQMGLAVHGGPGRPSIDEYRLPDLWCLHLYRYEGELELDGRRFPIRPGCAGIVPADTATVYRYVGPSEHCYCHFRPAAGAPTTEVAAMQDLGRRFAALDERLAAALSYSYPPERRQAAVWEVLWSLTEPRARTDDEGTHHGHPAVERAMDIIERNLARAPSVAELAERVGVSYSYLSKLFRQSTGDSVVGYVLRRRAERGAHLLTYSTLPIKSIAATVGMADLQGFNRLIHRYSGLSPTALRQRSLKP